MIIRDAKLETVCGISSKLPDNKLPEIAFAGKSNVGKSSLINALMNRKNLARTSGEPGKTRTINFYTVDAFYRERDEAGEKVKVNCPVHFVDLPGYGYAKVSKSEADKWGGMIERYLSASARLRAVFLLVDIRHEPGANDKQMFEWISSAGFKPVIIATKADKLKRSQRDRQLAAIRKSLTPDGQIRMIPFSAVSKDGLDQIYKAIREAAYPGEQV